MSSDIPRSYWQQDLQPLAQPPDELPTRADVVVIGGGLLGTATAYWLAQRGAAPLLIERDWLAAGATGRNGGLIVAGTAEAYDAAIARLGRTAARRIYTTTEESIVLLRDVLDREGIDCDYRTCGHLSLALGEAQMAAHRRTSAALHADGFVAELLDRRAVQQMISTPLGESIVGGTWLPDSGALHSGRLVLGLARAAQRHGAQIYEGINCVRLAQTDDSVRIETTHGAVLARAVVVAANAWLFRLLPDFAPLVTPVRGQALAYAPSAPIFHTGISTSVTPTGEYWQQTPDGTIVLGGCRAAAPGRDVGVTASIPTPEVQRAIEQVLPGLFPHLTRLQVERRWAGLMAFTRDYTPIVDQPSGMPGVWVVGGFSGHGMPFGLALGRALAQAATDPEAPPETLRPFRADRPSLRGLRTED